MWKYNSAIVVVFFSVKLLTIEKNLKSMYALDEMEVFKKNRRIRS